MVKKKIPYLAVSLFMFSLLISNQATATLSPYIGFEVGDTFEFQFSKFDLYREINGSAEIAENGSELVGNQIDIAINEITEANDGFFKELYGESTSVNVTETFKRGVFTTVTLLDMWFFFYYDVEMAFDYWIVLFDPEDGVNMGFAALDISDYGNLAGLPVLATTNTTFYESLEDEIPDYSGTPPMPPDRTTNVEDTNVKLNNRLTQASLQEGIFEMNVTNSIMRSGETSSYESWSMEGSTNFYVEINTQLGIVNEFSYLVTYGLVIGATTDELFYEVMIENLNPQAIKVEFQFYHGILAVIVGLIAFKFKKRKH
ncbi:MAG: hypothetical protein ACTSQF_08675 [Candidatus Heimdallarchaeaceae archaeon]